MTLEEVKEKFKQAYTRKWLEVVDEHEDEIFFNSSSGFMTKASSEDIRSYLDFEARRSTYIHKPFETCLSSKDHYEQMISSGNRYDPLLNIRRGEKITFGNANFSEVREALTEPDILNLTNTLHALYSMRWHRAVLHLLQNIWLNHSNHHLH